MGYQSLQQCIHDLDQTGQLLRIKTQVDPRLQMAEIHRQTFEEKGPALYFENIKGCSYPAVSNLFGTYERTQFIFRHSLERVKKIVQLKADPSQGLKHPLRFLGAPLTALQALPRRRFFLRSQFRDIKISDLPHIVCWPKDGGAFITLPQVVSRDPEDQSLLKANVGMYRIQLDGNRYTKDKTIGLHYQIHRGIGVHHAKAIAQGKPLKVSIFVGGPPAHTFAAIMPLPEGLSEFTFAGMLGGRAFRYTTWNDYVISCDADFCILGTVDPELGATLPEGPFGDHLGYYSLEHAFPFLRVDRVLAKKQAIWPFTVVGRPPQEDSNFGKLIHDIVGPLVPRELPGIKAVHAVDEAGVHPLLLSIATERYVPYQARQPQELLTHANRILGFGQCSLAKYLLILASEDCPDLDIHDKERFFYEVLSRADFRRDLHFQTRTTIDTLDYSGDGLNAGSKLVIAACGKPKRVLSQTIPPCFAKLKHSNKGAMISAGIVALEVSAFQDYKTTQTQIQSMCHELEPSAAELGGIALIVLANDASFISARFENFLWQTFTRSDPAKDVYGVGANTVHKHWGCEGPLIIDARAKPHHAPVLEIPQDLRDIAHKIRAQR